MKTFVDQSIWQGIQEYFDESGDLWRQEADGLTISFRRLEGDSWIYCGAIAKKSCAGLKRRHEQFLFFAN